VTDRVVAVLARPAPALPAGLVTAMLEDVVDLVTDTPMVDAALAVADGYDIAGLGLTWPGTLVVDVAADPAAAEVIDAVSTPAVTAIAVVAADVPDLPTLLLGKLFSALAGPHGASVAVCPAEEGGLVALAATLPVVDWLRDLRLRLDDLDAVASARAAAPPRGLSVGPGWRRVRSPADLNYLDPGLEGWETTRAYLG
jgi:hypothetical protein